MATAPHHPDHKQSVREHFGPVAHNYATAQVHRGGTDLDALVACAAPQPGDTVLDVGCGAGHTGLALAPQVARVEFLDLTPAMLEETAALARARGLENVTTRCADAEALPYPGHHFDIVASRLCAHHFQDPETAAKEMVRVLAPGGRLVLVDVVAPEDPGVDTFLNTFELLRDPSHIRDHTTEQWRAMFERAGARVDHVETTPIRIDFEAWLERIGAPPEARTALRWTFAQATQEAEQSLEIDPDTLDFTLTAAIIRARHPN